MLQQHSQKEDAIGETRQGVDLAIPIWKAGVGAPLAHNCCCQTHSKTSAIEKHVNTVGKQTQRATDEAVEELNYHKAEIQNSKVRNSSRISLNHDAVKNGSWCRSCNKECGDPRRVGV